MSVSATLKIGLTRQKVKKMNKQFMLSRKFQILHPFVPRKSTIVEIYDFTAYTQSSENFYLLFFSLRDLDLCKPMFVY